MIDSGALYRKPFFILYTVFAVLNLLSILGVLGFMFKGGVTLIVTGLFMIFALWIGFQLWWNRREKVNSFVTHGSEFVALPVFSHLFQTIGEWTGTFVVIAGTGASLGGLIGSMLTAVPGSSDYLRPWQPHGGVRQLGRRWSDRLPHRRFPHPDPLPRHRRADPRIGGRGQQYPQHRTQHGAVNPGAGARGYADPNMSNTRSRFVIRARYLLSPHIQHTNYDITPPER